MGLEMPDNPVAARLVAQARLLPRHRPSWDQTCHAMQQGADEIVRLERELRLCEQRLITVSQARLAGVTPP